MAARGDSPATKAEKCEKAMTRMRVSQARSSKNVEHLGKAVAKAILDRGEVTVRDGEAAGFTEAEFHRLFPAAIAFARKIDPRIQNMEAGSENL